MVAARVVCEGTAGQLSKLPKTIDRTIRGFRAARIEASSINWQHQTKYITESTTEPSQEPYRKSEASTM